MKATKITLFILSLALTFMLGGACQFLLTRPVKTVRQYEDEVHLKIPKTDADLRKQILLNRANLAMLEEIEKRKGREKSKK